MNKMILAWIVSIVITLLAAVYQRATGPTYPKKAEITVNNQIHKIKLLRSHGGTDDAKIEIAINQPDAEVSVWYRKYPTQDKWTQQNCDFESQQFVCFLPNQPPAGKLEYYVTITHNGDTQQIARDETIKIRFKGDVPAVVLLPHVIFMFIAMMLSNLSLILAATGMHQQRKYAFLTFGFLLIGGMILGPVVQKFAFGEYWTGVPFGWDLTDNKTLIGFAFWTMAVVANLKRPRPAYTIVAAIVLLLIYLIPHSMLGSELDHETGEVIQAGLLIMLLPKYLLKPNQSKIMR